MSDRQRQRGPAARFPRALDFLLRQKDIGTLHDLGKSMRLCKLPRNGYQRRIEKSVSNCCRILKATLSKVSAGGSSTTPAASSHVSLGS